MNEYEVEEKIGELCTLTKAKFGRLDKDLETFFGSQKSKQQEMLVKQGELQARLLEVEQKMARPRGEPASFGGGGNKSWLNEAAEQLIAGMRDSTSTRLTLPISIKAGLASGASDGSTYPVLPENLGTVSVYHPPIQRLIDLLPARPVNSNKVQYVRVTYASGSPAGNAAAKVSELGLKPQSSVETELVDVTVNTYAHWMDASKQILDDVAELQGILDGILRGGLLDIVDDDVFATLTTANNYTAFSPSGAAVGDNVSRIASQIAQLGGQNIIVAMNPVTYLDMSLVKASTSGEYLGLAPFNMAQRVVAARAVTAGKLLAFSPGSGASWGDRQGINLQIGVKNDDFVRNMVTLLCESRGATLVRDAAHIAFGDAHA